MFKHMTLFVVTIFHFLTSYKIRLMHLYNVYISNVMMTPNENIFRIAGHRSPVNPPHEDSDAELWFFIWSAPEQTVE